MSFVMSYEDALDESFKQASVYIDACFILAYLDSDDPRGDKVSEILRKWHEEGVSKLGISSHVFGEVVHNLFIQEILLPLEIYHKKQLNEKLKSHPDYQLGEIEESVSFLYRICRHEIQRFHNKVFSINISDLIKSVKINHPSQRRKLQIFYNNAIDRYNKFLTEISDYFKLEFLDTNGDILNLALSQMRLLQLEAYDALHYAIANYYSYDYFATLDGDFVHNLYNENSATKIVKIA